MAFQGFLRQSTAETVLMGPFVDDADGNEEEGGLTITSSEVRISKNSANIIPKNESTSLVHDELAFYTCLLDTTDTNTVGRLRIMVHEAGALLVDQTYWVLEEAIFDALFTASAAGFNASGLVTLAAVTHTGAVIPTVSTLTSHTAQTGDSFARLGAPAGASIAADLVEIEGQTDDIGAAGAGLTAINLPNQTMDITGDITGNLSGTVGSVTGAVGSVTGAVGSVTGAVGSVTGHTNQTGDSFARIGAGGASLGDLGGMSTGMQGEVNAEVVDVLKTDTNSTDALPGAPAEAASMEDMITFIYKAFRNKKEQTASLWSLYDDAGSTVDHKATVSNAGGLTTKEEIVTGP